MKPPLDLVNAVILPRDRSLRHLIYNLPWIGLFLLLFGGWAGLSTIASMIAEGWIAARAVYFTLVTMTVGYADVFPESGTGKVIAVLNSLVGLGLFAFIVASATMALARDNGFTARDRQKLDEVVGLVQRLSDVPAAHSNGAEGVCAEPNPEAGAS